MEMATEQEEKQPEVTATEEAVHQPEKDELTDNPAEEAETTPAADDLVLDIVAGADPLDIDDAEVADMVIDAPADMVIDFDGADADEDEVEDSEQSTEQASVAPAEKQADDTEPEDQMEYITKAVFTISEQVSELSKAVSFLSAEVQKVSDDTEYTVKWSDSTKLHKPISAVFIVVACLLLTALYAATGYLAKQHIQLQKRQDSLSELAVQAVENLHKRQAEFDNRFASLVGEELQKERAVISKESVHSKLNRLRHGASEFKLLRTHTGDWLVPKEKAEEVITDHDLITFLNQLYEKTGRSLAVHPSLPPHKVVVMLQPDGKGGTLMRITNNTVQ